MAASAPSCQAERRQRRRRADDRSQRRVSDALPLGRAHPSRLPVPRRDAARRLGDPVRPPARGRAYRIRHCRTALRRRPSLHGRRMEAGLRLRTACRPSAVRQRLFPDHRRGGHFLTSGHALEVDGPYGWVKAIREQIKNGVDHIKLNLSGGIMGPAWDLHTHSFLLEDELRAAFEICRKRGFKVMAHATNPEAVKNAVRLCAHSVEHGYIMDDECIALLLEHGTWYVPTLAISHLTASQATNPFEAAWVVQRGLSHALCCRAEAASDVHATWFRKALDADVRMALGSDIRPLKDAALLEMGLWVRDGATPWQTLVAATRHGAAVCGVGAELGTVEVGNLAYRIVVSANPLDDITNVRRLQLVLKEGRVVSDKRYLSGAIPQPEEARF